MDYRVSELADLDLEVITDRIAAENPTAADRVLEALHATFQFLARFPGTGQKRDDLCENLRVIAGHRPAHNYVVFFRVEDQHLNIVRVIHGARDYSQEYPSEQ